MGDLGRIRQVVTNLLSNSVKFTPGGGLIRVKMSRAGMKAQIVVADNGQGISQELLPRLFELYARADSDSTRGKTGLGLGLPLVHKLVEEHSGAVSVESAGEGRGTTFTVQLPLLEA
jgi:signal transduction histidine kinase